jgi:DNA-binding transcriptional LysR family regulator
MPFFTTAIRCFEAVARDGAIRRAAERLNLSASAVNRQILRLEEDLGVALFERLPRGMRLSAAGEVLLVSISRQQQELRGALQ